MKDIVADLFFSGVFCCFLASTPAWADPAPAHQPIEKTAKNLINKEIIASSFNTNGDRIFFDPYSYLDNYTYVIKLDKTKVKNWIIPDENIIKKFKDIVNTTIPLEKMQLFHEFGETDSLLGLQKTFWPGSSSPKYWGLTTVARWGGSEEMLLNKKEINLVNFSNLLPDGTSNLIVSGGGNSHINPSSKFLDDIDSFRGGVAFQRGLSPNLTLGMGVVYDSLLFGFSQILFQPTNLPIQAKVALLSNETGVHFQGDLNFKPIDNFQFHWQSEGVFQRFDVNWQLFSGLTLTAKGDTKDSSLKGKVNFTFKGDDVSFLANVGLNARNNSWEWDVKSSFDSWQLSHKGNTQKTFSELSYSFNQDNALQGQNSLFVKYETSKTNSDQDSLAMAGWRYHSAEKLGDKNYLWQFNLSYGVGSQGSGAMISASKALLPEIVLRVSYEQVSISSDAAQLKLELGSK